MRVALIDYDSGNLHSAEKALALAGRDVGAVVTTTDDPDVIRRADRIVLPGDGAFPACRAAFDARAGLHEALIEAVSVRGVPFLGICVGMQMLGDRGFEYIETPGLGWIGGEIHAIRPSDPALKVPHMGWNDLRIDAEHPLLDGVKTSDHVYFVHSWQFRVANPAECLAVADYGGPVTAAVGRDNIAGFQFHPEKSQGIGLRMLENFMRWKP